MPTFRDTLSHLHRQVGVEIRHLSAYEDGTECSETSAYKIQTPENDTEEGTQQNLKAVQGKINVSV
jgi:hypothetical protein